MELIEAKKELLDGSTKVIAELNEKDIHDLDDAIDFINGKDGLLKQLLVQKNVMHIDEIQMDKIDDVICTVKEIIKEAESIAKKKNELANVALQSDYEALYEAIVKLEKRDICPACCTLLANVTYNPYENAKQKLEDLKYLKEYRNAIQNSAKKATELSKKLVAIIQVNKHIKEVMEIDTVAIEGIEEKDFSECSQSLLDLKKYLTEFEEKNSDINSIELKLKSFNDDAKKKNTKYDSRINEISGILEKLQAYKANIGMRENEIKSLHKSIEKFENDNKDIVKAIAQEQKEIEFNKNMSTAYESLRRSIAFYNSEIPLRMAKNLSEKSDGILQRYE